MSSAITKKLCIASKLLPKMGIQVPHFADIHTIADYAMVDGSIEVIVKSDPKQAMKFLQKAADAGIMGHKYILHKHTVPWLNRYR